VLVRRLLARPPGVLVDPGVVDEDVDFPMPRDRLRHDPLHVGLDRDVTRMCADLSAGVEKFDGNPLEEIR
jgi:hypothetical protein